MKTSHTLSMRSSLIILALCLTFGPASASRSPGTEACTALLLPSPTLAELAALYRATQDRVASSLEREARMQDLESRVLLLRDEAAARGHDLDINRLWRDIMARQSPSLNNTTIDLGPRAEDLRATAASDYRSLLLAQAHAMGHERLLKALERSFPLSFEFARHTSGLEIQLTPVTQAQIMVWRLIGGVPDEETLPEFRDEQDSEGDHIDLGDGISINYNHPAERISAPEALAFVAWLNALTDRDQCRYTLLTAHQYDELLLWEDVRGARDIRRFAHVESVSTCSVQRYEPWGHGLRHLVGNVETWLLSGPDGAVCGSRGGEFSSDPQVLKDLPLEEQDLEGRYQGVGLRLARVCL